MKLKLLVVALLTLPLVGCFGSSCSQQTVEMKFTDGTIAPLTVTSCHPRLAWR